MPGIEHDDYNKLSDVIVRFNADTTVRANAQLTRINLNNDKISYHREVQTDRGIKMSREFTYFYTFEKSGDDFASIMVRSNDMILLNRILDKTLDWFEDNKHFMIKNKKLILVPTKPLLVTGLANNKYLQFEPIIYQFDESSPVSPGVRITLGDPGIFVDVDVDSYYGFVYNMRSDMFVVCQNIVNYLGRPDFGTNLYVMGAYNKPVPKEDEIVNPKKRRLVSNTEKKNRSFFEVDD